MLNHARGQRARRLEGLACCIVAKFVCEVVENAVRWNKVAISVTFNFIADGLGSLCELVLFLQRTVGIPADLLRPLFPPV